ncbi:hypothetical protein [Tepidibacter sp. Z1-5]|uniref:hypothetical protein n=1 Tax=Tepidibacter sp. Z1-5 TaxID=3134138 RepID=UPI0030BC2195
MQISEFKCLLERALALMEKKLLKSNESIIKVFINEYNRVLGIINYDSKDISNGELRKMKMFTRMYMETSSDYKQDFLYAMGDVESAIKKHFS